MHPNFLIIGTAKAGTTSLWYYLSKHPQVFMAQKKECHFFCHHHIRQGSSNNPYAPIRSWDSYTKLFSDAGDARALGEASPMYLFYEDTAQNIRSRLSTPRLIAILRNPADRAFSAWLHMRRDGHEKLSFEDALDAESERRASGLFHPGYFYREWGFYGSKLQEYAHHFDQSHIRLYKYEDFLHDNTHILQDICVFLNIDPKFRFTTKVRLNVSGIPRWQRLHNILSRDLDKHLIARMIKRPLPEPIWIRLVKSVQYLNYKRPTINPNTRRQLTSAYREDIRQVESQWGLDLRGWYD